MKEKLKELFEYTYVMNARVITLMNTHLHLISEKSLKLLSHTLNAQQIWNARINRQQEFQVWQLNKWEDINIINESNYSSTLDIINTRNLSEIITYQNSKGDEFTNKLEDILFHIINHSTYHRAQIATECRNAEIEPLVTDFIMYKREV